VDQGGTFLRPCHPLRRFDQLLIEIDCRTHVNTSDASRIHHMMHIPVSAGGSLVMRPHPDDLHVPLAAEDLVERRCWMLMRRERAPARSAASFSNGGGDWKGSARRISSNASAFGFSADRLSFFASFAACGLKTIR
jgi:hypothetical protein